MDLEECVTDVDLTELNHILDSWDSYKHLASSSPDKTYYQIKEASKKTQAILQIKRIVANLEPIVIHKDETDDKLQMILVRLAAWDGYYGQSLTEPDNVQIAEKARTLKERSIQLLREFNGNQGKQILVITEDKYYWIENTFSNVAQDLAHIIQEERSRKDAAIREILQKNNVNFLETMFIK